MTPIPTLTAMGTRRGTSTLTERIRISLFGLHIMGITVTLLWVLITMYTITNQKNGIEIILDPGVQVDETFLNLEK